MKAVTITHTPDSLPPFVDTGLPDPTPGDNDLLVSVAAISVNPVDTKVRAAHKNGATTLGWDAAGTVEATGRDVTFFKPGDRVFYAGDISRPGCNSELHCVDARIVGRMPQSLDFAAAAALPLTTITAWECLADRLGINLEKNASSGTLLVIGGAGGVGSMTIQLASRAGLSVIATASRPESQAWCRELGAAHIIDHSAPLRPQLEEAGFQTVDYIATFHDTDLYWDTMADVIAPQGKIVLIVEPAAPLSFGDPLKMKSVTVAWEFMFTRSKFTTSDITRQHEILDQTAQLVDKGDLKTTARTTLQPINATNLERAHTEIRSGHTVGKITLTGW